MMYKTFFCMWNAVKTDGKLPIENGYLKRVDTLYLTVTFTFYRSEI